MKKTLLLIFLLCVSLLLSACTATDPDNLFEMPEGTTESTAVGTESTEATHKEFVNYTGTYPYGNVQDTASFGFMLLDNEVVFSHLRNQHFWMYAYDLNTEEVHYYCDDATCKHNSCVSADFFSNIEVYDGKLYGTVWSMADPLSDYVAEAKGNDTEIILDGAVLNFYHHDDKLYVRTADNSLAVLEEGANEVQILMEEFIGTYYVIFDDYLYFQVLNGNPDDTKYGRIHLTEENPQAEILLSKVLGRTDGEYIYYLDKINAGGLGIYGYLCRCNLDGSNPERLTKEKIGGFNFDEEYIYYQNIVNMQTYKREKARDIYRFPKSDPTQVEKIATMPGAVGMIYTVPGTGKLFVLKFWEDGSKEDVYYVMNTDGSDIKQLELPED